MPAACRAVMAAALLWAIAPAAGAASGGPDAYGYAWRDVSEPGVAYAWEEISATGTAIERRADDANTGFAALSFTFPYRGAGYTRVAACTNGWISLVDAGADSYENVALPALGAPAGTIAVLWDDFTLTDTGKMYFQDFGDRAVIQWTDAPYYADTAKVATFQVVLHADGRIACQVASTTGPLDSATIGIESADDTDGLTAWFNTPIPPPPYAVQFDPPAPIVPVLDCAAARPLDCGASFVEDLATGTDAQDEYRCTRDVLDGKEHVWRVDLPAPTTVRYVFQPLSGLPRLLVLPGCDPNSCSIPASGPITLTGATGTFYFVVDCAAGDEGAYELRAECLPLATALDCASAAPASCGETVTGDLASGTAAQDSYWCSLSDYSGREQLWELSFPVRVPSVTLSLTALSGNPEMIVLYPCDANACLSPPGDAATITDAVGTYFVVVDCAPGDEGAYELSVTGGAPPSRDVGGTLRATGHGIDSVDFEWPLAPALRAGEAYAVLRSDDDPAGLFTLQGLTSDPSWTDSAATAAFGARPHVWFYDVRIADPCGNVSAD